MQLKQHEILLYMSNQRLHWHNLPILTPMPAIKYYKSI